MKKIIVIALAAVVFTTCRFDMDPKQKGYDDVFVAVERITGVPMGSFPNVQLGLSGVVLPENATNKKIEWSIKDDGGTNSTLNGDRLTGYVDGKTVVVTATITNGLAEGVDYTQDFPILISLTEPYPVRDITGIPDVLPMGTHTLSGRVVPENALYRDIVWSVTSGANIAEISPSGTLRITASGRITIRATVVNGLLERGNYTQDFPVFVPKNTIEAGRDIVYGDGWNIISSKACYWKNGELIYLDLPDNTPWSYTTGIIVAGGKWYIPGYYRSGAQESTPVKACYWVDGQLVDLSASFTADTETYSIAADGGYVYITGMENGSYCFWKINVNNPTATNPPKVTYTTPDDFYDYHYTGNLAVKDGKVYIPFVTGYYEEETTGYMYWKGYYWDENGTVVEIPPPNEVYSPIHPAVVNGKVYMSCAAILNEDYYHPVYWVVGDSGYTSLGEGDYEAGDYVAVIEQNGEPWFYGYMGYPPMHYRWDAAGNRTPLPVSFYQYNFKSIVFLDGDVYVLMIDHTFPIQNTHGDYNVGCTVVGGHMYSEHVSDPNNIHRELSMVSGIAFP